MLIDIAPRDRERVRGQVDGVDRRMGKNARRENGERAAAGAKIENVCDRVGVAYERVVLGERGHQEFADEAARDDRSLVDVERNALDIGAVQEVSRGLSRRDPRCDQRVEPFAVRPG